MIENEEQYRVAKEWAQRFEMEILELRTRPLTLRHSHPKVRQAQEDSLQQAIDGL